METERKNLHPQTNTKSPYETLVKRLVKSEKSKNPRHVCLALINYLYVHLGAKLHLLPLPKCEHLLLSETGQY